jgi:hypothetical protein
MSVGSGESRREEAQRSLKTEQRALRGPNQQVCGMFEPDPFGAPARRMVLIYLVMPVAVFVYAAAIKE